MEIDLGECSVCVRQGACCSFTYHWPDSDLAIETSHQCPFVTEKGLCVVYPARSMVPWCDFDSEGNRGTDSASDYPVWCPHVSVPASQTFDEVFAHAPFTEWSEDQKESFQTFVNGLALEGIVYSYAGWGHVFDPQEGVKNLAEGWDPKDGYLHPAVIGPCVSREERDPDRGLEPPSA